MIDPNSSNSQISLAPLGAGDLIDRSVRFYRKNFWTFILIASPPIVIGAIFLIAWMMIARSLFTVNAANPGEAVFYSLFVGFGSLLIWFVQLVAVFVVMGGASRNFVRHILFGESITLKETYKNVKSRIGGLVAVSGMLVFLLSFLGIILFNIGFFVAGILILLASWAFSFLQILAVLVSIAFGLATAYGTLWLFFLVVSRFVYVPQVMLVEGQGAFAAIGRSMSLAGKNVKRVGALFIFTLVAISSAIALLYVPLIIYAWINGIDFISVEATDIVPAWLEISKQVVLEVSLILLTPVLMIGLCLLYVDERVRSEGYDIELMAVRRLGAIPSVPQSYINPLQPALSNANLKQQSSPTSPAAINKPTQKPQDKPNSTLGLD